MRKVIGLLAVMVLLTLSAFGQDCKDCITENPLVGVECKTVNGGSVGGNFCIVLETGCLLEGYPDCYSCGAGPCEGGSLRKSKPSARYASFRADQTKAKFNIHLSAEQIRSLSKRSPELAYAIASLVGSKRPLTEGSAVKFTWLPFRIDANDAELWLSPGSARAKSYFATTKAEGLAALGRGEVPVEVLLELNGNELSAIGLGGIPAGNGRYIKVQLGEGGITRTDTRVAINRR